MSSRDRGRVLGYRFGLPETGRHVKVRPCCLAPSNTLEQTADTHTATQQSATRRECNWWTRTTRSSAEGGRTCTCIILISKDFWWVVAKALRRMLGDGRSTCNSLPRLAKRFPDRPCHKAESRCASLPHSSALPGASTRERAPRDDRNLRAPFKNAGIACAHHAGAPSSEASRERLRQFDLQVSAGAGRSGQITVGVLSPGTRPKKCRVPKG